MKARIDIITIAAALTLMACGGDSPISNDGNRLDAGNDVEEIADCQPRFADEEGNPFATLSQYCFFRGELALQEPMPGVVPFDVAAPLYSDESEKSRFIILPEGEVIGFEATERWNWPDNTIIAKTFYYPLDRRDRGAGNQILETRLLIKEEGSWKSEIYIWDEDQQEARHNNLGRRVDVTFLDDDGQTVEVDYRIPNRNQCTTCHIQDGDIVPLGPHTRQLRQAFGGVDGEPSQLERFSEWGLFDRPLPDLESLPHIDDYFDEGLPLDVRARAYLDANCAHCHNPDGRAASSGLYLGIDVINERQLGVCKSPVAAGAGAGTFSYGIVPGHPEESIMIYRMDTTDAAIKMPELPLTTIDHFGVDLVSQWISEMEPTGCP